MEQSLPSADKVNIEKTLPITDKMNIEKTLPMTDKMKIEQAFAITDTQKMKQCHFCFKYFTCHSQVDTILDQFHLFFFFAEPPKPSR